MASKHEQLYCASQNCAHAVFTAPRETVQKLFDLFNFNRPHNIGPAFVFPVDAVVGLRDVVDAEARSRGAAAHVEDDPVVASAEEVRVDPVAAR